MEMVIVANPVLEVTGTLGTECPMPVHPDIAEDDGKLHQNQVMEMTQVQIHRRCHCLWMTLILQVLLVELREEMQPYLAGK